MATQLRRKHIAFIEAYTTPKTPGYLNASESARLSGFSVRNPKNAGSIGNQLMKKPEIATRIDSILEEQRKVRLGLAEISKDELTSMVGESLAEVPASHANKPRYYEIIAKLRGFWTDSIMNNLLFVNTNSAEYESSVTSSASSLAKRIERINKAAQKSSDKTA